MASVAIAIVARKSLSADPYLFDSLLPDLVGHDRRASAYLVYLYLWRHSHADGRAHVEASLQTIASDTGLGKRTVQASILHLQRRRLIVAERKSPTSIPRYHVLRPWRRDLSRDPKT
jgi:hypothetical protein